MAARNTSMHIEVENVLSKLKKLEDAIKIGMEATQECALDCEENEEGCSEVKDLKEIMLAYANMTRDIIQWDEAARKTVSNFREKYNPTEEGDKEFDVENTFRTALEKTQSGNKTEDLEKTKLIKEFTENIWNVHHSGQHTEKDEEMAPEDEEILISQVVGDNLICPITKTEMKHPVKSKTCGHTFDKTAIEQHINRMKHKAKCPIVGCPEYLSLANLEVNNSLVRELKKRHR